MSNQRFSIIPARAVTDLDLRHVDLRVLALLGRHTNSEGWCRRSQGKMAGEIGHSRGSVCGAISRLEKAGYIEKRTIISACGRDSALFYRVILDQNVCDRVLTENDAKTRENPDFSGGGGCTPHDTPPVTYVTPPVTPGVTPINDPLLNTTLHLTREGARAAEIEPSKSPADTPADSDSGFDQKTSPEPALPKAVKSPTKKMAELAVENEAALIDALGDNASHRASGNFLVIAEIINWLTGGCDMALDILPVIRARSSGRSDIRSWSYFRQPVFDARNARLQGAPPESVLRPAKRGNQTGVTLSERITQLAKE